MGISLTHTQSGYSSNVSRLPLEFRNVGFCDGRNTGVPEEILGAGTNSSFVRHQLRNRPWATLVGGESSRMQLRHPC